MKPLSPAPSAPADQAVRLRDRLRRGVTGYVDRVLGLEPFELGAAMTLVMAAISMHEPFWYLQAAVLSLALTALIVRPVVWNPLLWFALLAVYVWSFRFTWFEQNNHDFLKLYWCIGVGASLLLPSPRAALRWNARVLIGLCFLFATLWKLLSADYVDNSFLHYFLLQDSRFELITHHVGGVDRSALALARLERAGFQLFGDPSAGVQVVYAATVGWIAPLLTWWTVFIEGLVAAAFLWPLGRGLSRWRDPLLLAFMATTYFIAPIVYFGWMLCALGVVQSDGERFRYWPLVYVGAFILLLVRSHLPV